MRRQGNISAKPHAFTSNSSNVISLTDSFGGKAASHELRDDDLSLLRSVLDTNFLRLLRLPAGLEQDFRTSYRSKAAAMVRSSVYGLITLYLLVVLPVAFLIDAPMKEQWIRFAVYPIGLALLIIWCCTRFISRYTEQSLMLGTFLALLGPTYAFMLIGDGLLGLVAGCETVYVMIVVCTMLMLRIPEVIGCALAAFALAAGIAVANNITISWLNAFLFFWVPLLICAVAGFLLEFVARRNYVQATLHQQDRLRVVNYLATLISKENRVDDILTHALARVCNHNGWPLGKISAMNSADLDSPVLFSRQDASAIVAEHGNTLWCAPDSPLFTQAIANKEPCMVSCAIQSDTTPLLLRKHLVFPITLDNRVLAIMELFCEKTAPPDQRLFTLMDNVSLQLGRVFEHAAQKRNLQHKAMHDALTGLPNRAYLFEYLEREIARAKRDSNNGFCVLFVDADHFKWVNDSLGHLAGDKLLISLANRLRQCIRDDDFVARLGGDEFAIVVRSNRCSDTINTTIDSIRDRLLQPFDIDNQDILLGLSVGVVMCDTRYNEAEELLRDADMAMYSAKKHGRGRFEIFNLDMHKQAAERLKLMADLQLAIDAKQCILHYQPLVDISTQKITGFEALTRWHHPELGMLMPNRFISMAEETGLISALTDWVLQQACKQLKEWQQLGNTAASISINLCASYIAQPDMPEKIQSAASAHGINPKLLHIEITETQVADNADICLINISRLHDMGFFISIDDFGTGYSSLNYLANFKVNALKIDKTFLDKLCDKGKETHIVQIIIDLAHYLNLNVIAEGVETKAQLHCLQKMGCDIIQGYYYSRPISAEAATSMMKQQLLANAGYFQQGSPID